MEARDIAIHVVVLCSLLVALVAVALGYRGDVGYLNTLLYAVIVCLLAGMLFMLERIEKKLG